LTVGVGLATGAHGQFDAKHVARVRRIVEAAITGGNPARLAGRSVCYKTGDSALEKFYSAGEIGRGGH
jgi:hypothetical protein